MRRRGDDSSLAITVIGSLIKKSEHDVYYLFFVLYIDERVHFWQFAAYLFAVTRRKTPGNDEFFQARFLQVRHIENILYRFLFCRLDKRASVDYHHVRFGRVVDDRRSRFA